MAAGVAEARWGQGWNMDVVGWVWWVASTVVGWGAAIVWFLVGGWVATLAQILVVVLVLFGYKYGWRAAPQAVLEKARRFFGWGWAWVRRREDFAGAMPSRQEASQPGTAGGAEPRTAKRGRTSGRSDGRKSDGRRNQRNAHSARRINVSTVLNGTLVGGLVIWLLSVMA